MGLWEPLGSVVMSEGPGCLEESRELGTAKVFMDDRLGLHGLAFNLPEAKECVLRMKDELPRGNTV